MCLAQGQQQSEAGEARALSLQSSTQSVSHCTPIFTRRIEILRVLYM